MIVKRNYNLVGRILYKTRPDIAIGIEDMMAPGSETNIQRIFFYYSRFDSIHLRGFNTVNRRRLFIAAVMFLYYPRAFENGLISVKPGFVKNIAACFSCKQESITRSIREVLIMYKAYEEFGEKVNEVLEEFKNIN